MRRSPTAQTLLIVDGYNIIGSWPHLQKLARRSEMELARLHLIEKLASYVAFRGDQAKVVFDAYAHPAPTHQETSPSGIEIFFTNYGETADTWIERTCAQLQWENCRVRVATSDRVQQLVVAGYDAEWLTAKQLQEEVKRTAEQIRQVKPKGGKIGRGIDAYLDANTRDRLAQWRIHGADPAG